MKKKTVHKNDGLVSTAAILIMALLTVVLCSMLRQNSTAAWQVQVDEPVVRLHVRASGDSPAEQQFKMTVAARVRQFLSDKSSPGAADYYAYLTFLQGCLPELERELQAFAADSVVGSQISVRLSREEFPLRTYGRRIYPAGYYTALTVTVGEGTGENWWCLLFPPLCLPPAEENNEEATPEGDYFIGISETAAAGQASREEEQLDNEVRWRSKIWELLRDPGQYIIEKAERIFYN